MLRNALLLITGIHLSGAQTALGSQMETLMAACAPQIHPTTLRAVIRTESSGNLYAIGDNGNYRLPKEQRILRTLHEINIDRAVQTAQALINAGHVVDLSIGQLNSRNLPRLGMTIRDAFDPCKNLSGAATILVENYLRASAIYGPGQRALLAAISAYNTGNFSSGFSNGYVYKVALAAKQSVPEIKISSTPKVFVAASRPRPRKYASSEVEGFR